MLALELRASPSKRMTGAGCSATMIRGVILLAALTAFGAEQQRTETGQQRSEEAAEQRADMEQEREQEDARTAETASDPDEDDKTSPETFVPSENISEDFDVPFPVDI